MEWLLEIALVLLLAATLFHAIRLERALGVLKHDRAALQELVAGFNSSTRLAEAGIDRLDTMVRAGRPLTAETPRLTVVSDSEAAQPRVRSQAERDLLKALRMAR